MSFSLSSFFFRFHSFTSFFFFFFFHFILVDSFSHSDFLTHSCSRISLIPFFPSHRYSAVPTSATYSVQPQPLMDYEWLILSLVTLFDFYFFCFFSIFNYWLVFRTIYPRKRTVKNGASHIICIEYGIFHYLLRNFEWYYVVIIITTPKIKTRLSSSSKLIKITTGGSHG